MDVLTYNNHQEIVRVNSIDDEAELESQTDEDQEDVASYDEGSLCTISEIDATGEKSTALPFRKSLFANVAPYIAFQSYECNGSSLPHEVTKHLKWRLSTITPQLVRRTLINSGYRLLKKSQDWCGTWGKHMTSVSFKSIKESQKINHFPGTFQIGRKDRLWRNFNRMMIKYGKKEFDFIPRTYVLPQDLRSFRQIWEKQGNKEKWIIKPPASARGTGIRVVNKWSQIPKKRPIIVQQYIAKPMLIDGAKFDLRLYVLVTSFNPLRIYLYPNGLVRFASVKYSDDINYLSDRFMHLTNYSINKSSASYTNNDSPDSCSGHKWTIKTLWNYLEKRQVNVEKLWSTMKEMVIKTMIAGESSINGFTKANVNSRYNCYELFGVDILLDENLKPWLLEVNISPSLQSASPLDVAVKGPLIRNVFNIVGYQLPICLGQQEIDNLAKRYQFEPVCQDYRLHRMTLSFQERQKQYQYVNTQDRDDYLDEIIDDLTPDDVRHLIVYEDELTQLDRFEKIFPTATSHEYFHYFETPRYYNMLLDAWEAKYANNRDEGIARLQKLCKTKYHLQHNV
ncbi:tubulin monoglutamylase TTLL4-like [Leptopilina boulardi]|uniref:tubulin monoglutamylase TTLL4-like n=1 Tax=Leptopilina boulardi TaxID=63433 RepID=UPI0021F55600|nr:tubulin monoglutamylase TTLL4-like [Leptopilina boulardi]XP_051163864.1 tubulin monoglutamylase TTLL4-like [Leptopilina boulardi]XP_051163865.1 tubulin monoglutamylase TTLL4-like [Leptopilina boulardi]XP_051163866.1 tubulin monoglutamylase TTLL4-like [Leptopilina boulardi]XP_051163867.1 tubulin monoglutamylase TTLL4-like [Leptopilina boulardi]XP_051163868.1 tubulin monoglutamylase TTLL4-like [Leptopilina boulardi]